MRTLEIKGLCIGEGTPKTIVSLMGTTVEECLAEIEVTLEAGANMLEWRADFALCLHDHEAMAQMGRKLAAAAPTTPLLFTFRSTREGGSVALPMEEYVALNRAIIKDGAVDLVDIEAWLDDDAIRKLTELAHEHGIATVVSYHNFQQTPKTAWMVDMMEHMVSIGADIPKIAVMANSAADTLRLLAATDQVRHSRNCPLLTMAMGRQGAITRLVGEQFGSAITFCALQKASAPGQVDLERARRIMADLHATLTLASQDPRRKKKPMELTDRINGHTRLVTLLGSPIAHSASPATHTLSFEKLGMNIVYLAFDVQPDDLPAVMGALRVMRGWDGTNVTMPCKQAIIPYLDSLSPAAELMGSVNVVKKESDGHLAGHNTDGVGFMQNLRKHGVKTEGACMTLVGSGGAGSAILVQAALDGMAHIDVFAREGGTSYQHAQSLIARIGERTDTEIELHDLADHGALRAAIGTSDILANATSVGMGEGCTDVPVPADMIRPGMVVADVIYLPRETQLIRNAAELGCTTVPGLGMMLEQAAEGERIWYGVEMPTDEIAAQLFA